MHGVHGRCTSFSAHTVCVYMWWQPDVPAVLVELPPTAHPDKPKQECSGEGPSAWKELRIAKGQHKPWVASKEQVLNSFLGHPHHLYFIPAEPEVIYMTKLLCSTGREQQSGRATSTLMSLPCTSKHPNSPIVYVHLPSTLEKLYFYPKGSQKTSFPRSLQSGVGKAPACVHPSPSPPCCQWRAKGKTSARRKGSEKDGDLSLCAIQDSPEAEVREMRALFCHQPPCQKGLCSPS